MADNSYNVRFTDAAAGSLQVVDETFNTETSLTFVGRNKPRYAQYIAENFLHLLENFAADTAPQNPIAGQCWFNTVDETLKIYNGAYWSPASGIITGTVPETGKQGDLCVDPLTNQLMIHSGSGNTWDIIGPQFSSGILTGPKAETLIDSDGITRPILSLYVNNDRVAILSETQFLPKVLTTGFSEVFRGITLSSETNGDANTKLWGTSYAADNLNYDGTVVNAINFLRSDRNSEIAGSLKVKSNDGLTVGKDLSFNINSTPSNINLTSLVGKSVNILFSSIATQSTSGLYVKAGNTSADIPKVGIGNNTNPQTELDVTGDLTVSGFINITGTSNSSISTLGGLSVAKQAVFSDIASFGNTVSFGKATEGSVILPSNSTTPIFDIGSATKPFRNVYALAVGNILAEGTQADPKTQFYGVFNGALQGSVNGSALSLTQSRSFELSGDVTCDPEFFNGSRNVTMKTTIGSGFFTSKDNATSTFDSDQILIYRSKTGIQRSSKSLFLSSVPTVPVGAIFPFAGEVAPTGYLLCDGSEVVITKYKKLFDVIGYAYRSQTLLVGYSSFALPDLRGRFPLGKDNMDNDLTIAKTASGDSVVHAGGNRNGAGTLGSDPANRVHDTAASTIGYGSGNEAIGSLASVNATGKKATVTDVVGNEQASSIMNPYQTINYIIFTGNL